MRAMEMECPVGKVLGWQPWRLLERRRVGRCVKCAASLAKSACLRKQRDARSLPCGESLTPQTRHSTKPPIKSSACRHRRNQHGSHLNQFASYLIQVVKRLNLNLSLLIQSVNPFEETPDLMQTLSLKHATQP
jgi:hypothetical protein